MRGPQCMGEVWRLYDADRDEVLPFALPCIVSTHLQVKGAGLGVGTSVWLVVFTKCIYVEHGYFHFLRVYDP